LGAVTSGLLVPLLRQRTEGGQAPAPLASATRVVTIGVPADEREATRWCLTARVKRGARQVDFFPQGGIDPQEVSLLVELHGGRASRADLAVEVRVNDAKGWEKAAQGKPFSASLRRGENRVAVRLSAPHEAGGPDVVKLIWWQKPTPLPELYVLAVGV